MARWETRTGVFLLAAMLLGAGCVGPLTETVSMQGGHSATPGLADEAGGRSTPATPAPSEDEVTVSFHLSLTSSSQPALEVQSVSFDPEPPSSVDPRTTTGRLVPGGDARIAYLHASEGTRIPATTMEIVLYDGLGISVLSFDVEGFRVGDGLRQGIELRSRGPGQIGFVQADGPLEIAPQTPHAVPQYGYLLWPDGHREALPGFEHVIEVPEGFPNFPAGRTIQLRAEVPEGTPVLWRLGDGTTVESHKLSFETEPGVQPIHVSVGPGESTTDLRVHTDLRRRVNGTIAAAVPGSQPAGPVDRAEHPFEILPEADRVKLLLRPEGPELPKQDLDLLLVDGQGDEIASSRTDNASLEVLTLDHPPLGGEYAARVQGSDGAAMEYTLSIRVAY